ncbi:MAG TPA: cation transporter [Chiayiivirga sp.]|nr:cation transporter [Chiayiivirga sp.]
MAESCGCGEAVDIAALETRQRRVLMIVLAINIATFAMMLAAAIYSSSSSLLSGSLDNLGDALTYLLSLAVIGASTRAKAKVALFKGLLILGAAIAVAGQIAWRLAHPEVPIFEAMGIVALLNLGFNAICLWLLTPYRGGDVNMSSAWECSRNDMFEGAAVLLAAAGVWLFDAGWPDLVIAGALLVLFLRSAWRVLRTAWRSYRSEESSGGGVRPLDAGH